MLGHQLIEEQKTMRLQICHYILLISWLPKVADGFVLMNKRSTIHKTPLCASVVESNTDEVQQKEQEAFLPYAGKQPSEALPEIFIANALPEGIDEELLWVPQTETVSFRPLCFCCSGGYYVNLLRVKGAGVLSRHKHPGPVHGHVLKGKWRYLEHDWVASEGSYVFEPPGKCH